MSDYHVHIHPHGPYTGEGPPPDEYPVDHIEAYVEAASANGAQEVGFTEHLYRCIEAEQVLGHWWESDPHQDLRDYVSAIMPVERVLSLERYVEAVLDAKDRGLPVKLGLEVDFFPETVDAVLELLKPYPFDFLIAAPHWIGAWNLSDGQQKYELERRGHRQGYEDYFRLQSELASSGHFDVIAHADVIKKFGVTSTRLRWISTRILPPQPPKGGRPWKFQRPGCIILLARCTRANSCSNASSITVYRSPLPPMPIDHSTAVVTFRRPWTLPDPLVTPNESNSQHGSAQWCSC